MKKFDLKVDEIKKKPDYLRKSNIFDPSEITARQSKKTKKKVK